ncbi:MAG: FAD-dependent oxidoreductase [Candidatus Thorarchaeota archaeon]|nr:FAD-dependent oxidoreductase [Candidatus Thorarchaeota archaeon]
MNSLRLMEPTQIKDLALENRLVMLATHLGYCENGEVSDKLVGFYAERARHHPGLIIVGGCYTEHLGMSLPTMIGISENRHIAGLRRLVDAVHSHDVPIAAQLYHAGRYAHSLVIGEQAVSASPVPCRLTRETPRAMTLEEIKQTIENYGAAASRAREAGFDAVEILGSAGYLINQFLASCTNQRDDEYGGDLEQRARFPLEVIRSVREAVGPDYPVLYRMSGADFVDGGLTLEDNQTLAPKFVKAGVDCINVTGGWHETRVPQITMDVPRGHFAYLAEGIAEVVDVPVIACNRINSSSVAQHILNRGKVQLIGMSRGLIADPELPTKIREGRASEIRMCIGCNEGCLDRVFAMGAVTCAINPLAGYEDTRTIGPPGDGRIAVVGAGPAGLEVSRVLALRGFQVTLFEKESRPGGGLLLASKAPGRGEFMAYVTHMWREMRRLGIDLRLDTRATADMIVEEGFDHVFCTTGTLPAMPPIDGVEAPTVTTAVDILSTGVTEDDLVVIVGGNVAGCYAALYLSNMAKSVEILDRSNAIGMGLGRSTRWVILKELKRRGVKMSVGMNVIQVTGDYVVVSRDGDSTLIPATVIVMAAPPQPNRRLPEELQKRGVSVSLVGAVESTTNLLETVHSAFGAAARFEL